VLTQDEARELLEKIDTSTLLRLRDRAIIAMMIYTFGRVGAVIKMRIEDYYTQGRRGGVRLHEKGGKRHEMPCNHNLEAYLDAYIKAAGYRGRLQGVLVPHHSGQDQGIDGKSPRAVKRLPDDPPARDAGRDQDPDRQSHVQGHRDHSILAEWWATAAGAANGSA
jgi:integrase